MSTKKNIFTKEGYQKLKEELERLKTEVRLEIAARISEASEYGDLSENAAYQSAMEQRDMIESKIAELEEILSNAKIVKSENTAKGTVTIGSKVTLQDTDGKTLDFEIVGTGETDLQARKFNADSPLVSAVLGKKVGEEVEISLPGGMKTYKVIKVE